MRQPSARYTVTSPASKARRADIAPAADEANIGFEAVRTGDTERIPRRMKS